MSYVDNRVAELKSSGVYSADRVEPNTIKKVLNMDEWIFHDLDLTTLESYLGLLAQQVLYIQQEINISEAREIELGNAFKMEALPLVIDSKIRSVEERWLYGAGLNDSLRLKFDLWQQSIIEATLKKNIANPIIEKLLVLKKIYDEQRMEGKNRSVHKHGEGI